MTEQPWQWDEATWRGHVEHVRAGRPLRPAAWPGGAKVAVALSFDSDHETPSLRDGDVLPGKLAQGEYGARVGVPRILKLLQRHDAPASFFVPAVSALLHDGEVKSYVDAGHEVALHGWIHERNTALTETEERDLAFRAADVLERLAGTRPVGIRTPSWDFSAHTLAITRELGLAYDSSLMADDDCYELLEHGEPTGIVELPVEWIRDDAPYFMMDRFASLRPYTPPRGVLSIWRDEFDAAYAEGGIFQLTMHPHIIGHRSRIAVLAELLDHIGGHDGVWYATHAQIADHVLREQA
ncbi:polysaccharide deacetylase [Amycolatopsis sp. FBCC-B4732]|uniref:polysaccharide deacetylase family protein n=1 Tax=Amycolatopsis sp. FBCC-B4732 TaxID=3079339 RepID=UPI001FF5D48C|nr:polysaccharide deacetylase [Amycolatopsis sp. FBCC-B4732]UOX92500.1 polysaccharide deacetylase [Amycolatopsis sp. FBCC-B4732]